MDASYLSTTRDVYEAAALNPHQGLCCTATPVWRLPELAIPEKMLAMNYGCGRLAALGRDDIHISASTHFYDGGGCC